MNLTQNLQKWGNSTGIRIPKKVITKAKLKANQTMAISLKGDTIILTPVKDEHEITLETMLAGVTPEQVGGEYVWGDDIGAEIIHA